MDEKQQIEKHVAKLFLERTKGISIDTGSLLCGNPLKNEPDILYADMGLEIGAVLRGMNIHIDNYEKEFLSKASEAIKGKIPDTVQIQLVMQDDRDTVEHTATPDFRNYRHLPQYLDGIFVYDYKVGWIQDKVVLNQKTRLRSTVFPNVKNAKQFYGFVEELANYVNSLKLSDFTEYGEYALHHKVVTDGKVIAREPDPLGEFISPKILEKLGKDKYSGSYQTQILLLHNYSLLGNTEFSSDIHFYTHHRNDIFNLLWKYINENNSFELYDGIYFLDFSVYALNSNFELVDFKNYSKRTPSEFLYGYDEIRIEVKPLRK